MNVFEMVVILVVVITVGSVYEKHLKAKMKQNQDKDDEEHMATQERIMQLEKRIRVLESIVTSENYELKQRFKHLENE